LADFQQLFQEDFDVPGLGRFVLGRFWRIFTPTEQQEFLGLFENYVVLTYSEKLSDYAEDGGRPSVTGCRRDPDGAIVTSKIIRGSGGYQPIQVDWRLTADGPRPSSPSCGNRLPAHLSVRSATALRNCKPSRLQPPP